MVVGILRSLNITYRVNHRFLKMDGHSRNEKVWLIPHTETIVENSCVMVDIAVDVITVVGLAAGDGFMLNSRLRFSMRGFWVVVTAIEFKSTRSNNRFSKSFCWQFAPLGGAKTKMLSRQIFSNIYIITNTNLFQARSQKCLLVG